MDQGWGMEPSVRLDLKSLTQAYLYCMIVRAPQKPQHKRTDRDLHMNMLLFIFKVIEINDDLMWLIKFYECMSAYVLSFIYIIFRC